MPDAFFFANVTLIGTALKGKASNEPGSFKVLAHTNNWTGKLKALTDLPYSELFVSRHHFLGLLEETQLR